jgi:pyrroline-5-carboxylate reductase
MGSALARAACQSAGAQAVLLANRTRAKAERLAEKLGCSVGNNTDVARQCAVLFLGVKPQIMGEMLSGVAPILAERTDRFVLVTMAAGLTCQRIQELAGGDYPVVRLMPNTPAAIGQGMIQYCSLGADEEEVEQIKAVLAPAGLLDPIPEQLIDAASAVSGCGPAYAYLFLEALADGGVACGLPREKALTYAAQMLSGAAQMVLTSGQHPGALKDAVCSPGGTTIQGVRTLEERGFRAAAMDAVIAAYKKTVEIRDKR